MIPLFAGFFLGVHAIARPASPPNFESFFKRKYRRPEWNERNPEAFTQKVGWIVLLGSILYGCLIVIPWILR
ncbi:hypothetical protein [Puniceicoccus vermicola]|uniref:Uncharacterized protein n=1 Tax=Puniceicoccus vermicola TaxID=388746 RepID=A0A7X1B171_9BACT|nr:hypothetical protein [Puniceicoccus vermicola]MBC2603579.1 hypothetical protein [Puniceicoccus vermicola]